MTDAQGSKNDGEHNAEELAAEATGSATAAEPAVDAERPLDEAPVAFLSEDPDAGEVDYEALAAELDRLEAETAAAAPVSPSQPEPAPAEKKDQWFEPAKTEVFAAAAPVVDPPAPVAEPALTAPPAVEEPAVAPAPIFVQAPEPPRKRGNRGATGLIGLVAALVFAGLYGGALYAWQLFVNVVPAMNMQPILDPTDFINDVLLSGPYWVTVVAFWLAFWLLGVFVNRARWWSWVVLGLFVALVTYAGFLGGVFFEAPFWNITPTQGIELLKNTAFAPVGLFAFIIAREVTIWFGGWASRRGARITAHNKEARDEYERVMAEGPSAAA